MKKAALGMALYLVVGVLAAAAQAPERWLHMRVVNPGKEARQAETVRVNVPLSVAEQVLPAIKSEKLHDGKVQIEGKFENVDLRALLNTLRNAPDNEFVTVEEPDENVRVSKKGEFFLINVQEKASPKHNKAQTVQVKIPIPVVAAMLTDNPHELDVLAGLRALKAYGDIDLVTVNEGDENVHIWVDSRNSTE